MWKNGWTYQEWLQQHVNTQRSEVRPVQRMGAVASQDRVIPPVPRMGHLFEYRLVSPPDEEALEDDFVSLSIMTVEKELPVRRSGCG